MATLRRTHLEMPVLWRRFLEPELTGSWIKVEEFVDGDQFVLRAELPDVDPDKDVEVTVSDGMLHIHAERQEKSEHHDKEGYSSEFRYGSLRRSFTLPAGTQEDEVEASYRDGILEVRVPTTGTKASVSKVPVRRG
ncbi:MAG TPA: heat-shock protein Hsp20 [Acidimicrobiaceae bacterium]|nr:heat-shock protein Hsp20 [Acidimicrobiaceae bacterium]